MLAPQLWSRKGSGRFWVKRDESSRSRSPSDVRLAPRATMIATQYVAMGPGCVKSPTDAMILRVNRRSGALDVRLRGGD